MKESETHYRNVYKSDHLGVADIEDYIEKDIPLTFTIDKCLQLFGTKVAGKKGDFNIIYWKEEGVKPWVVNSGNGLILKKLSDSGHVEKWAGMKIQLYIDPNVTMMGERTGGVRIVPKLASLVNPALIPSGPRWNEAVNAYRRYRNMDKILARVTMTEEHQKQLIKEAGNA